MKHFVIGTAGHVDHGKTVLVKALTGKDTDRLKEEKERGISIELGFASFDLPSGILAGVVDVPGHERFIKNMLAGVGGMDMVLLVVAADEGIMPQTREHLDIINLLQVPEGVVVLTKADLVDEEWLEMVREEIRELVKGTFLENAPVAEVSAVTGKGIPALIQLIDGIAGRISERSVGGQTRMPIDRVFSMTGFGTVVTGTLIEGRIRTGDVLEILPQGIEARVRGLQVHGNKVDEAEGGQRVAVNLAGLEREEIERGSVLAPPGSLKPSHRIDVKIELLQSAGRPLANRARVRVHIGTAEILARVILLEDGEMNPGDSGYAQMECEQPVVAARGDRLVIRSYSPMRTIAGGKVIDASPVKHKRFSRDIIESLMTKEKGTPEELLLQYMISGKQVVFSEEELRNGMGIPKETLTGAMDNLFSNEMATKFSVDNKHYYIAREIFLHKAQELVQNLEKFHSQYPLRAGWSKEEIRTKYFPGLSSKLFNGLMEVCQYSGFIRIAGDNIAKHGFVPGPREDQKQLFINIEDRYLSSAFQTPGWDEVVSELKIKQDESEEILNYFLNGRLILRLDDNILIHSENIDKARELIINFLRRNGEMTLAESRDLLQTSRKYALPVLNYFDKEKVTRRVEDKRVLY